MTANNAACPHCSGERPPHLVPRNYLCRVCQERSFAYVDGVAYGVWEGRFGGVFLSPLPSADPPAAVEASA